ncbi:MAG: hypothetical protein QXH20_01565 [Candidatus Bathyarchaeia archaeon]
MSNKCNRASPPNIPRTIHQYYTTDTAYLGMKFNITVWVQTTAELGGAQVYLEFDDSIINVTRWICPHGDPDFFLPEPPQATELPASPDPGYVHLAPNKGYIKIAVCKGGLPPTAPWGHSGKIAIIEFIITSTPPPALSCILKINASDTYLLNPENEEIPDVVKEDGSYTIIPEFSALIATLVLISSIAIVMLIRKKVLSFT